MIILICLPPSVQVLQAESKLSNICTYFTKYNMTLEYDLGIYSPWNKTLELENYIIYNNTEEFIVGHLHNRT